MDKIVLPPLPLPAPTAAAVVAAARAAADQLGAWLQAAASHAPALRAPTAHAGGCTALMVVGALGVAGAVACLASPGLRRAAVFWKEALPGFIEYKLNELKVKRGWYASPEAAAASWERLHVKYAPRAYNLVVRLEGCFYKLGQIYGSRIDTVPREYASRLSTLVDRVPPKPIETMRPKIEADLGQPLESVFVRFDGVAIGAASIGQVHKAELAPELAGAVGFSAVAVKTTYVGGEAMFRADLVSQRLWMRLAQPEMYPMFGELEVQVMQEFDLVREAQMQQQIADNLADEFPEIVVPRVVPSLVSRGTYVMEFLDGQPIMALLGARPREEQRHTLVRIMQAFGKTMLCDGLFHGDPHPGNLFLFPDEPGRIGLLDFGEVKELDTDFRLGLCRLVVALGDALDGAAAPGAVAGLAEAGFECAEVGRAMRALGFRSRHNRNATYTFFALASFDSLPVPNFVETWLRILSGDPWIDFGAQFTIPMRAGIILRGVVSLFGFGDLSLCRTWRPYAERALAAAAGAGAAVPVVV